MTQTQKGPAADDGLLKVKSDALRLLAFQPRSVEELRSRLKLKRYPDDLIAQAIDALKRQGLLDDTKFAKLFAESRLYSRPTGKKQLETDLKKKGLPQALIAETLGGLKDYDEKKMARELVQTRFHRMTGVSAEKKKTRLFGFLKRRGFGNDVIFAVMKELFSETTSEGLE